MENNENDGISRRDFFRLTGVADSAPLEPVRSNCTEGCVTAVVAPLARLDKAETLGTSSDVFMAK